eukprot:5449876-Pleurochrysis_carterae.AAC.1
MHPSEHSNITDQTTAQMLKVTVEALSSSERVDSRILQCAGQRGVLKRLFIPLCQSLHDLISQRCCGRWVLSSEHIARNTNLWLEVTSVLKEATLLRLHRAEEQASATVAEQRTSADAISKTRGASDWNCGRHESTRKRMCGTNLLQNVLVRSGAAGLADNAVFANLIDNNTYVSWKHAASFLPGMGTDKSMSVSND